MSSHITSSESMAVRSVHEGSSYLSAVEEEEPRTLWELWAVWEEDIVHTNFWGFFEEKINTSNREKKWEWKSESESERCIYRKIEKSINNKREKINDYIALMIPEIKEMA